MFRLVLLPLFVLTILTISLHTCLGQTFQYSRGWTNGKRSDRIGLGNSLNQQISSQRYLQNDDNILTPELFDDHLFKKCLLQMPRFMKNVLGHATYTDALSLRPTPTNSNSNGDKNNNLFGSHRQSNEIFDELNGGIETNDYGKH